VAVSVPLSTVAQRRNVMWQRWAVALVAALVLLEALWELVLAPVRPGGSWLALKALPLALLWWPLARGDRHPRQIASLVLPLYFGEGIVRALTEHGRHAQVAALATARARKSTKLGRVARALPSKRAQASDNPQPRVKRFCHGDFTAPRRNPPRNRKDNPMHSARAHNAATAKVAPPRGRW